MVSSLILAPILLTRRLNYIFFFVSAGVYCSGPVCGRIVDARGPRIILIVSFAFLLGGYSGIKYLYDSGLPPDTSTLPALSFYSLVLCSFLTGSGGFGGLTSSLNSTVKSFPDGAVSKWVPRVSYNVTLITLLSEHPQVVWFLRVSDYQHSFSSLFPILFLAAPPRRSFSSSHWAHLP